MTQSKATNITWHHNTITRQDREKLLGQRGALLWFTGLSGAGKSTVANGLDAALFERGYLTSVLDGDNIRHGLNSNLGFSPADRTENIRRIGEVGKLFVQSGVIAMTAFISPYRADRDAVRSKMDKGDFIEVYIKCPLEVAESRDPKGLYKQARAGKIPEFTGISAPYEEPENAELVIDTSKLSVGEAVGTILQYLIDNGIARKAGA